MERRKSYVLVALFVLLILTEVAIAESNGGKGNGNNGNNGNGDNGNNGEGKGDNGNGKGKGKGDDKKGDGKDKGKGPKDKGKDKGKKDESAYYRVLSPLPTGQEQARCEAQGACYYKTVVCPSECPQRKPKKNKQTKGCYIECTSKCEATCKWRKPNCNGYGSLCYDPRFIGGDGVMFYFHGARGGNFAIVSDHNLQINAHFIGTRPAGRTRDFTWVQAFNVMFESHNLVIAAKRVDQWDDKVDEFTLRWNDEPIALPDDEQSEWRAFSGEREIVIERTDERNSVRVTVSGLVQMDIKVRPIGKEENRVHNYQLPENDAFAHLETQFKFFSLSELVEGVLGKTYRPDYLSGVKTGVPMPIMGGEDKYQTPSLFSPVCRVCMFKPQPLSAAV
ncbi:PREDICTED: uncharacterized protein LOC104814833 [Tarenaya hassleriana]|uniref:uncharacterized protein LOC104814833 n=1 Tax=Tarenaya hassleriana TaxID=28532 RepID=UPI00053C08E8|nr:PREDICTED: uncharacterized protein LOC104814833 [Tarenaya hassleriana]